VNTTTRSVAVSSGCNLKTSEVWTSTCCSICVESFTDSSS
jgi:hypothetical protein